MDRQDGIPEVHVVRGLPVVVLVSSVDRRILPAIRFVSRLPGVKPRALHVAVDPEESRQLADDWMSFDLSWLPLHIVEPSGRGIADAVRNVLDSEPDLAGPVTVVVPELTAQRWWHPLLHRQTARHIAAELQRAERVTTVIVPFTM